MSVYDESITSQSSHQSARSKFSVLNCCRQVFCSGYYRQDSFSSKKDEENVGPCKNIYKGAFLPKFMCKVIEEKLIETLPQVFEFPIILMICHVPSFVDLAYAHLKSEMFAYDTLFQEINAHFRPIVEFIHSQGGDLILYSNCMMYFMWKINEETSLPSSVSHIINVASYLQTYYQNSLPRSGIELSNVIGISMGELSIFVVGEKSNILSCCVGKVIQDCLLAVDMSSPGNIVVTDTIWQEVEQNAQRYSWSHLRSGFVLLQKNMGLPSFLPSIEFLDETYNMLKLMQLNHLPEMNAALHPLPKSATTLQQLEILSSMSQVCVGAAYVKDIDLKMPDQLQIVFLILNELVIKHEGIMPKITYDEGIVFTFYFGFPGFKHADDAIKCLMFCNEASSMLKDMDLKVVFRVALGMCFNGVVGSEFRMEAVAFGKPVHSVLEISHHFLDVDIMCCINIVLRTRRELGEIFSYINRRTRGLRHLATCYSVNFEKKEKECKVHCVGRVSEKKVIVSALEQMKSLDMKTEMKLPLIVVSGSIGSGRSNFVRWLVQESHNLGYSTSCFIGNCSFHEPMEMAFEMVKAILMKLSVDSESKILHSLGDQSSKFPLYLLNKYMNTKFSSTMMSGDYLEQQVNEMLITIVSKVIGDKPIFLGVDDGDHIGKPSWLFIQDLLLLSYATVVVTFVEPTRSESPFITHLLRQQFIGIVLGPLIDADIVLLACHILDVISIHKEFVIFLTHHSKGNPLRLQEIMLLPQLQHHICLSSFQSVVDVTLKQTFITIESGLVTQKPEKLRVCDILDPEGLASVYVPQHLLEVVKERTSGLMPEEQMLIKKCACLGDSFSLFLLDIVCPEYTEANLRLSLKKLLDVNILVCCCDHLVVEEWGVVRDVIVGDYTKEFCPHLLKFTSKFLRNCVNNFMPQSQKERLHLFIVSMVSDAEVTCDSCRTMSGTLIFPPQDMFVKAICLPKCNLSLCHCVDFKLSLYSSIDYHLMRGNAEISKRIKFFLKAAEIAVEINKEALVNQFVNTAEYLIHKVDFEKEKFFFADLAKAAVKRLKSEASFYAGKDREVVETLGQALMLLGRVFPDAYLRKSKIKQNLRCIEHVVEEAKCLGVGCALLIAFGKYSDAYAIGKLQLVLYKTCEIETVGHYPKFVNVLRSKTSLLIAGAKSQRMKSQKRIYRWSSDVIQLCCLKLSGEEHVSVLQLRTIIKCLDKVSEILFENNDVPYALCLSLRIYEMTKALHGRTFLLKVSFNLCLLYLHEKEYSKCLDLVNEMLGISTDTGNHLYTAICHSIVSKVVLSFEEKKTDDNVNMCNQFALEHQSTLLTSRRHSILYWVCASMTLWCFHQKLDELFNAWKARTLEMKDDSPKDDYFSISATLDLILINIYDQKLYSSASAVKDHLDEIERESYYLEENAHSFAPVLIDEIKKTKFLMATTAS